MGRARILAAVIVVALAGMGLVTRASAHQSGCHSNHSCPSDRHTYLWANGGTYWSCAATYNLEYDPARDTTIFSFDGMTWGCYAAGTYPVYAPTPEPTPTPTPAASPTPTPTPDDSGPVVCNAGRFADYFCTPGARFRNVTAKHVCKPGYARRVRHVTASVKRRVFAEYGVTPEPGKYEIDHLIALEIGGSNSIKNLWPEAYAKGARRKDRYEKRVHRRVCSGRMKLRAAQRKMAYDWTN